MQQYANLGGDSNVLRFEIGPDSIAVSFKDGTVYLYGNLVTGQDNVEKMKALAEAGRGLGTFIEENVGDAYVAKFT